jgi:hypothetical protein
VSSATTALGQNGRIVNEITVPTSGAINAPDTTDANGADGNGMPRKRGNGYA